MTDLKCCFLCMLNEEIPWFHELLSDLSDEEVELYSVDPAKPIPEIEIPDGSYTITDNTTGTLFARKYDTGYLAFLPDIKELPNRYQTAISDAQCVVEGFDEVTADFVEKMFQRKNGIPWTILTTPRTIISEISEDDIDSLFKLYDDPEIKKHIPPLLPTREEELEFEKAYISNMYGFFGYGFWKVLDIDTKEMIGRAGISHRKGFEDPELGYLLSRDYRGKGIGYEICTAIIQYAEEILGMETLNAFIGPDNLPSIRLAKKLGFIETGEEISSPEKTLKHYVLKLCYLNQER